MKRLIILTTLTTLTMTTASSVEAQSFLENMARRAVEGAAERAASALERGLTGGAGEREATESSAATSESAEAPAVMRPRARTGSAQPPAQPAAVADVSREQAPSTGPAPWPNNLNAPRLRRPGQLQFSAALEAEKEAFKRFGAVSCNDCEGGESYDTAAKMFLNLRDMWAFDSALGALAPGQALTWRGRASTGRITVVGEAAVGPFSCKQLRWELTRGDRTATRPGLVCLGKSNPDADNDRWIEVF